MAAATAFRTFFVARHYDRDRLQRSGRAKPTSESFWRCARGERMTVGHVRSKDSNEPGSDLPRIPSGDIATIRDSIKHQNQSAIDGSFVIVIRKNEEEWPLSNLQPPDA